MKIKLEVNGEERSLEAESEMPLLWALRDLLDLKGTRFGCGRAQCGACTVLVDGRPMRSCVLPVGKMRRITTIEGLSAAGDHPLQVARRELNVPQCGYCQSGQMRAQMEGSKVFGLGAALQGAITVREGAVEQSNFHDYEILRITETPRTIGTWLVESDAAPGGVGEPAVPPVALAVANAIHAATGRRLRELPLLPALAG